MEAATASPSHMGYVDQSRCDVMGHFTIGYYFLALDHANRAVFARQVQDQTVGLDFPVQRCRVEFKKEMHAGQHFQILSEAYSSRDGSVLLKHQLIDAATREVTTTATCLIRTKGGAAIVLKAVDDDELFGDALVSPEGLKFLPGTLDAVMPAEVGFNGNLALGGYVHRFSASALRCLQEIGIDQRYISEQRRGYSTFAISLEILAPPASGDVLMVESTPASLGTSSIRFAHRMLDYRTGRLVAMLDQSGVHMNLEARKSERVPDSIRRKAEALSHALV